MNVIVFLMRAIETDIKNKCTMNDISMQEMLCIFRLITSAALIALPPHEGVQRTK